MIEIGWAAFIWTGLIATTVATGAFWIFRAQKLTRLSPTRHLGCYLFRDPFRPQTDLTGLAIIYFFGMMVFPWVYGSLLGTVLPVTYWAGALLGLVHGVLAGALLPVVARGNRCIRAEVIDGPGVFGVRLGRGTPIAILFCHVTYGVLLALILPTFA